MPCIDREIHYTTKPQPKQQEGSVMLPTGGIGLRIPGPQESLQLVHGAGQRLQPSRIGQRPLHGVGSSCLSIRRRRLLRAIRLRARNLPPPKNRRHDNNETDQKNAEARPATHAATRTPERDPDLGAFRGLRRRDLVPRARLRRLVRGRGRGRRTLALLRLVLPRRPLGRRAPPRVNHLAPARREHARGEGAREGQKGTRRGRRKEEGNKTKPKDSLDYFCIVDGGCGI